MLRHSVLGLLRDGLPRHGYGLMTEYRARSGERISIGNLYRELGRLAGDGLVQSGVNPPDADPRRIPYQITERGRQVFDQWLVAPLSHEDEVSARLVFVDQVPPEALARLLDRWQEELWFRGKALARGREDALARGAGDEGARRYDPLPALLSRQLKHVTAELEFLKEFRTEFDAWAEQKAERRRFEKSERRSHLTPGRASARRTRERGV
jgi:DNA-binding PadR family transcriptional regulator